MGQVCYYLGHRMLRESLLRRGAGWVSEHEDCKVISTTPGNSAHFVSPEAETQVLPKISSQTGSGRGTPHRYCAEVVWLRFLHGQVFEVEAVWAKCLVAAMAKHCR